MPLGEMRRPLHSDQWSQRITEEHMGPVEDPHGEVVCPSECVQQERRTIPTAAPP